MQKLKNLLTKQNMPACSRNSPMELDVIHNIDCLEFMRTMPDGCVDFVLTDPPYGIGESKNDNVSRGKLAVAKSYPIEEWDNNPPPKEHFEEIFRISKNQIIFGGNHLASFLPNSPCWLVWDKNNHGNDFADCELIYTSFRSAVRKFVWTWNGMLQENMGNKEKRYHRCQKPAGLIMEILKKYTKENDTILDCYAGSGSIPVACYRTRRHYIGCEISPEYCAIAEKRIQDEKDKLALFGDLT